MTMWQKSAAICAAVITKPTIRKVTNAMKKPMRKLSVISAVSKVLTRTALTTAARITPMTDITELALLVSKAKASVFTLEYISQFEPADIDSDDVDLRFEVDGRDTGTNVSIVDECGQAAKVIGTLVEALEKAQGMETYWKTQCCGITDHCEELQARIAELEEAEQKLCAANVTLDARAELAKRQLAELCRYSKRQLKNVKRATQLMSMHGIMAFWS
ncbi:hypothetical protein [Klebsiella pneumoniae]|uniref:hypothetical protein n=1 Tax=Klebsiella pneumoniae TaxID=573 RepID=UPI001D0F0EC0|nr:hypothetical protein [Klebsiella pneumoniae]